MDISQFKNLMKEQAQYDRDKKQAQVTAEDLSEALVQASIELSLPIKSISYEILQRGRKGLFGVGQQECVIIAYESDRARVAHTESEADFAQFSIDEELSAVEDIDGKVSVRCLNEKVFLRVRPPQGNGLPAEVSDIQLILRKRGIAKFDELAARQALDEMSGDDIIISSFVHNPASDAMLDINLSEDDMAAYLMLTEPGPGGEDLTENTLLQYLDEMNIIHGVDKETITEVANFPDYTNQILIAQGTRPVNGTDAVIEHLFETDRRKLMPKEIDGRVDFRNMNLIQNVIEGQVLAKKIPATEGVDGSTVTGETIPARDGNDIELNAGENAVIAEDDSNIYAELNGQVILSETGRISVAPVFLVPGDVNLKNGGNIDFIGAVVVKGSVEDGYSVKASKNIEINGTVGKCNIISGADIMVSQGVAGKEEGYVSCAGNLIAKFIEHSRIVTKGDVIVRDGIVNAQVDSNSSILCLEGKRAAIVGGHLRASKKVVAKTIGSVGGAETLIEVGFEPEKRQRYEELEVKMGQMSKDISEIELNLSTIEKNPKMKANLTAEKLENLKNLKMKKDELTKDLGEFTDEFNEIKEYLDNLKAEGTVSVEGKIFPGVRLNICGAEYRVKNELKWTTFYKEGPVVRFKEFSEKKDGD